MSLVPQLCSSVGGVLAGLAGDLGFHLLLGVQGQPLRGRSGQQPGDHLDVPQARRAGGERGGGAGQQRRQDLPVQVDPWAGLFGGGDDPAGLDGFDPEQSAQRGVGSLPVLGEHPPPLHRRHRLDGDPLRFPLGRGGQPQHSHQIIGEAAGPPASCSAVKDSRRSPSARATGPVSTPLILLERLFDRVCAAKSSHDF